VFGRISLTARIGLALVLIPLACLAGWASWYFTRAWEPLNIPISLGRSHTRAEFDINVDSSYLIRVEMNTDRESGRVFCADGFRACESVSAAVASWSVWNGGRLVVSGKGERADPRVWWYRWPGPFRAGPGHYVLNLDVPEDQSRLDLNEPHLVIYETGRRYFGSQDQGFYAFLISLLCVPLGAWMIILAAKQRREDNFPTLFKGFPTPPGQVPGGFRPVFFRTTAGRSHRVKSSIPRPFSRLSAHSLVLMLTFLVGWTAMVVLRCLDYVVPMGVPIHLIRPGVTAPWSPGIQPLRVSVRRDGRNPRPSLYVDSQLVAWEDLGALLKKELAQRPPDWPVYVEGDPDLDWRQVAEAIDAVRGQQAEVVLLTGTAKSQ
jgi:biopolymer transport protein ExbD